MRYEIMHLIRSNEAGKHWTDTFKTLQCCLRCEEEHQGTGRKELWRKGEVAMEMQLISTWSVGY